MINSDDSNTRLIAFPCSALVSAKILGGILLLFVFGGCSIFEPYVNIDKLDVTPSTSEISLPFPNLRKAVIRLETIRVDEVQYKRNEQTAIRAGLGLVTFGAAAGAGIAALYDAHRDLVLGLGLGAASSYSAGLLFSDADRSRLYDSANNALSCVAAIGQDLIATGESTNEVAKNQGPVNKRNEAIQSSIKALGELAKNQTGDVTAAIKEAKRASARYSVAVRNARSFQALDDTAASKILAAGYKIILQLNKELLAREPSLDAILQAARGIGGIAPLYEETPTPKDLQLVQMRVDGITVKGLEGESLDQMSGDLMENAQNLNDAVDAIDREIKTATNTLDSLGETCAFQGIELKELQAVPDKTVIAKGASTSILLTGGRPPFNFEWTGTPLPQDSTISVMKVSERNLVLTGSTELKPGDYKLRVTDSRAIPSEAFVTVHAPEEAQ